MELAAATLILPTEHDTAAFAQRLAPLLGPGDALLLSGPVGAGKSFFARALIRARLGNPAEDVPSPSFTLVQTYLADGVEIWHCDLYRLVSAPDLWELGLAEAFEQAICLIEWPDRLGQLTPQDGLHLNFAAMDDHHSLRFAGSSRWALRLESLFA
jgi:tRNA threonylcarbamoyladenosine biosynthesis protein TsaE